MVNSERITAEFMRQAAISSPSLQETEMARYLEDRFRQLGAEIVFDDAAAKVGGVVGNLIARLPGSKSGEPFLFSVHMDTVVPCDNVEPVLIDGVVRTAGETILGADDKAGIAEVIEALEVVREQGIAHVPIEVVVTVGEEIGLVGAKALDYSLVQAKRGIALDTPGVDWVVRRAPGANRMQFEVFGQAAHAGVAPEKGLSAIEVAARAVAKMRLGRIDFETTANIGTVEGGLATNIVAEKMLLTGEARSHDAGKLAEQTEHMLACFEEAADELVREIDGEVVRAVVKSEVRPDFPRMAVPEEAPIVDLVQRAAAALGREMKDRLGGGGSDANIFNEKGIEMVIVGTGMQNVHSTDEEVAVDDLVQVAEFLVEVVRLA
jgi:tripeptide aminopeptidase